MSQVMTFSNPAARAMARAAITPAAGPDRAVRTGRRFAVSTVMTPPLDCTIKTSPEAPLSFSAVCSRSR